MNEKYIKSRNEWLQKLDVSSRRHLNCLRFGINETDEHIKEKLNTVLFELRNNYSDDFLTEIYSSDRRVRGDVLLFSKMAIGKCCARIVEIAQNETENSLNRKRNFWERLGFEFIIKRI